MHLRFSHSLPRAPGLALGLWLVLGWGGGLALASGAPSPLSREAKRAQAFRALSQEGPVEVLEPHPRLRLEVYTSRALPAALVPASVEAVEALAEALGALKRPITIQVGGPSTSMAVAYNPSEDRVILPVSEKLVGYGLEDLDRLRHEVFHAGLAQHRPDWVTPQALKQTEIVSIHEAAADFFASLFDTNGVFGDRYFRDRRPLRSYRNQLVYALVPGGHAKGNALTSHWLRRGWSLKTLAAQLKEAQGLVDLIEPEVHPRFGLGEDPWTLEASVPGLPESPLGRYRVSGGETLVLRFPAELSEVDFHFVNKQGAPPQGFSFQALESTAGKTQFRVQVLDPEAREKILIRLTTPQGLRGLAVVYLSPPAH